MVKKRWFILSLAATAAASLSLSAADHLGKHGLHCHGHCHHALGDGILSEEMGLVQLPTEWAIDEFGLSDTMALDSLNGELPGTDISQYSPKIVARVNDDPLGNVIDNVSSPARWAQWRYAPVQLTISVPANEPPTAIRFWHNGKSAHPDLIAPDGEWMPTVVDNRLTFEKNFQWSNPPLGKSNLQVEIKSGERWSRLSAPLHLEIVPPQSPMIVAVGTQSTQLYPYRERMGVIVCDSQLLVQLANHAADATILADVDGFGSIQGEVQNTGIAQFDLAQHLTSGRYRITLRYAGSDQAASMSGEESAVLWIDFHVAQQQVSLDREYAKIHHQALRGWHAGTTSDPMAKSIGDAMYNSGLMITLRNASEVDKQLKVQPKPREGSQTTSSVGADTKLCAIRDSQLASGKSDSEVPPAKPEPAATGDTAASDKQAATDEPTTPKGDTKSPEKDSEDKKAEAANTLDQIVQQQANMQNALEDVRRWRMIREEVKHAIMSNDYVTDVSFDTAATFPRRTYGSGAQEHVGSGLTILEGMRLKVAANGDYCLSFSYIPPQVPSTVHLQLQFQTEENGPWHALSIAPMTLQSVRELDKPTNETMHVVQGHSNVLERAAGDVIAIRRQGSATMGYGHKILQSGQQY